ncbi:sensor histidine kinase [Candidatus Omnitrophota bacterium]
MTIVAVKDKEAREDTLVLNNKACGTRVVTQVLPNSCETRNHINIIAHEINNPLDAVMRYVNLASACIDDEGIPRSIEYLHEAKKGLQRIVKIIKDLACLSHGAVEVDINSEIEEACCALDEYSKTRNIVIENYLGFPLPQVPDFGLQLVFNNVIKNACDAMESGGTLVITSERKNGTAKVDFIDTGRGIPREALDKIFDPFFTTKKHNEGSGLGLAISQEIVKKYQGSMSVASECGNGATFSISIPVSSKKGSL